MHHRGVAQLVARLLWEQDVAGSIPVAPTMSKGSIAFPVGPLAFKKILNGILKEKGRGIFPLSCFLFDDLPQKLKGVFAQRRSHGNELDNVEPAFPAFILRNMW